MKKKPILWYFLTLTISMMFNSATIYAEEIISSLDDADTTSAYDSDTSTSISSEYTSDLETSISLETEHSTTTSVTSNSLENITTYIPEETQFSETDVTTLEIETTIFTTETPMESTIYSDSEVAIITPTESVSSNTLEYNTSENNVNKITSLSTIQATVHTVSNTNIEDTKNSPQTKHTAILIPILLLMAGALFMGATSKPKIQK